MYMYGLVNDTKMEVKVICLNRQLILNSLEVYFQP